MDHVAHAGEPCMDSVAVQETSDVTENEPPVVAACGGVLGQFCGCPPPGTYTG
jgi:hypothetical protein